MSQQSLFNSAMNAARGSGIPLLTTRVLAELSTKLLNFDKEAAAINEFDVRPEAVLVVYYKDSYGNRLTWLYKYGEN